MSYRTNDPLSGDLSGNESTATVVSITGATGVVNISSAGNVITWNTATTAPGITQASESAATKGANITITPQQSTHATDQGGGNLILALQTPTGAGAEAGLQITRGGTISAQMGPYLTAGSSFSSIWLGPSITPGVTNFSFLGNGSSLTYLSVPAANSAIEFVSGGAASNGLVLNFSSSVATDLAPNVDVVTSLGVSAQRYTTLYSQLGINGGTNASTGGSTMNITAEAAFAGSNANGGNLVLAGGAKDGSGTAGLVNISGSVLSFGVATVAATGSLRFPNATTIMAARDAAGTGDMTLLATDSSNGITMGDPTNTTNLNFKLNGSGSYGFFQSGTVYALMNETHNSFIAPLAGLNNGPLSLQASSAISTAANISLTGAQNMTPVIPLNGTVKSGGCTITLSNTVGGIWLFDLTNVTFGGNNLIFTTGSGTSATVSTSGLSDQFLLEVCVVASNVVSVGGLTAGAASGDLSGNYPGPTVVSSAGSFTIHSNVFQDATGAPVTTTNATLTTLYTDTAITTSNCYDYVVTVVGIEPSTLDVYRADLVATYINTAGTVSVIGSAPTPLNVRGTTNGLTWGGASLAISGTQILVQVTGATSTTIDWNCSISRVKVA